MRRVSSMNPYLKRQKHESSKKAVSDAYIIFQQHRAWGCLRSTNVPIVKRINFLAISSSLAFHRMNFPSKLNSTFYRIASSKVLIVIIKSNLIGECSQLHQIRFHPHPNPNIWRHIHGVTCSPVGIYSPLSFSILLVFQYIIFIYFLFPIYLKNL